jgi:hypothetical protein
MGIRRTGPTDSFPEASQRLRSLARWVWVLLALLVIDVGIRGWFVPGVVEPRYAPMDGMWLLDRTQGRNLTVLLDQVTGWFRNRRAAVRVIIAGDSTVHGELRPEDSIPFQLQASLRDALRPARVEVVDFSEVGIYARETLIMAVKALKFHPDVFICQLTLRDVIDDAWAGRATNVEALVGDPWVLQALPWSLVRERYPASLLIASAIESHWALFAYRHEIFEAIVKALPLGRVPEEPPFTPPGRGVDHVLASNLYNFPNTNSQSVEAVMQACRRVGGPCFVYIGPFNPAVNIDTIRDIVDHFRKMVRTAAESSGVDFEDYWDAFGPTYFRQRFDGAPDAIHYNSRGYQQLGRLLARRAVMIVRRQRGEALRPGEARPPPPRTPPSPQAATDARVGG